MERTTEPGEMAKATIAEADITGLAIDTRISRCYSCNKTGSKMRVINGREGLAICNGCDPFYDHSAIPSVEPVKEIVRTTERPVLSPEDSFCAICHKELISGKRLDRKMDAINDAQISDRDKERIENQIKSEGWRAIGQNKYAHNRCANKRIKRGK